MSTISLIMASSLLIFAITISKSQKMGLEKDIVTGIIRAVVQLVAIGFILEYMFGLNDWRFTLGILIVMIFNAAVNAAKRGKDISKINTFTFISISIGTFITISIMLAVKVITFAPSNIIPISGMIVGNCMVAAGLTISRIKEEIRSKRSEIITKLSLGATVKQASEEYIRIAVKNGMIPTIDTMKTLGIVQLPGMMTGLILAGASPLEAIKFQILVTFMLSSAVAISSLILGKLVYKSFFTPNLQLKEL